jgi:hypothetical protein
MFLLTIVWKNAAPWPGPTVMNTFEYLKSLGGIEENILYGNQLIRSQNPIYVEFREATTSEYDIANKISWRTVVLLETQEHANVIVEYLQNRVKAEIQLIGLDLDTTVEEIV